MSWFAAEIDGPLVLTRGIHFAAAAAAAGVLMFRSLVAEPALRPSAEGNAVVEARLLRLTWAALAVVILTGVVWLTLETMSMASLAWDEAMRSGAMQTVVNETQFGQVFEVRAGLSILLAACVTLNFGGGCWVRWRVPLRLHEPTQRKRSRTKRNKARHGGRR